MRISARGSTSPPGTGRAIACGHARCSASPPSPAWFKVRSARGGGRAPAGRPLRRTYFDWLLRQLDSDIDGAFGFTDGQATAAWDLTPAQSFRATVIAGRS